MERGCTYASATYTHNMQGSLCFPICISLKGKVLKGLHMCLRISDKSNRDQHSLTFCSRVTTYTSGKAILTHFNRDFLETCLDLEYESQGIYAI